MVSAGQRGEQVRLCRAPDGVRIAFAVHGQGAPIVVLKTWVSHLQYDHEDPMLGHLLESLGRVATVIRYDERGYGLSDWDAEDLSLEAHVGDLGAVIEAAGFERSAVLAMGQGGQVAICRAAPRRRSAGSMTFSRAAPAVRQRSARPWRGEPST